MNGTDKDKKLVAEIIDCAEEIDTLRELREVVGDEKPAKVVVLTED